MVNIPEDIMSDILLRLPVKSIGRFRYSIKTICYDPISLTDNRVGIWNPSTNEYKILPATPLESLNGHKRFEYGFGYDYKNEDFKVVNLVSCDSFWGYWSEVQVYTLRSNSWRRIGKIPYDVVVKNGATKVIISFDFEQEIIQEIALPIWSDEIGETNLCVLGGSLFLLGNNDEVCELWEFKNYETEDSWVKLFTIHPEQIFVFDAYLIPLQKLENGHILLGIHNVHPGFHLILYDPEHEKFTIKFYEDVDCHYHCTSIYLESLVSLNSGTYISAAATKESNERRLRSLYQEKLEMLDMKEDDYISSDDDAENNEDKVQDVIDTLDRRIRRLHQLWLEMQDMRKDDYLCRDDDAENNEEKVQDKTSDNDETE
ncbi:F-box protein CPR1-like [Papaver somniferum]|uniref:F-box protein CPR1-like n=1 Tax=Papaver somniferum TaxID=3469 RepID=UPI000E6F99A5|nr:F-box protein CPR1-like [Papaver somniferum]